MFNKRDSLFPITAVRSIARNPLLGGDGSRRPAFTLVELLVVLAVVSALAALILPVLASGREAARRAACSSNLRQLYGAMSMYCADHSGALPLYQNVLGARFSLEESTPAQLVPEDGLGLVSVLGPYIRNSSVWFCPSDPERGTQSLSGGVRRALTSFGTGITLEAAVALGSPARLDSGTLISRVFEPAHRVLLRENVWGCLFSPRETIHPTYSHNGSFNYLYFDGHVQRVAPSGGPCIPW